MSDDEPRPLTPREAAAYCNVDETTVRKWLTTGRLAGSKRGRLWLIPPAQLDSFRVARPRQAAPDDHAAPQHSSSPAVAAAPSPDQSAPLLEALRQLEALRRENRDLAGQLGYLQSQLEVERDRVRALAAPRDDTAARRPWWRLWP